MQKARRQPSCGASSALGLRPLVGTRFQVLFHSPPGVLFTFPSRYWFTIGGQKYLALGGGPPRFPQGSSCPGVLGNSSQSLPIFPYGAITPYGGPFQTLQVIDGLVTLSRVCCPAC